ncbi:SNF2-related protein [Kribbella qitaiheensis]|uniref:DEAD/DEAH box helicase n=1 Tax=Kribbella qitaiheensis TaxID=1544730 RepID=UPI003618B870
MNGPSFAAGVQVRQRATGDAGVVLEAAGDNARVAFASGTRYVSVHDLESLELEPHLLLAEGVRGDANAALLRLLARLVLHAYRFDSSAALSNARLEPKLHQAFVAHRVVAQKIAPRMILADEVGLGKTIEAGLIIKELRARKVLERVLIVTPASLTRQWQSELASKFNEPFEIIDGAAAEHYGRGGKNPFERVPNVICSLPFATQAKRQEQIAGANWDMVVFDEAHRVRRTRSGNSSPRSTQAYRLAEDLKDQVHGLLLLTATPVQLHEYELFSLIELVEPGLFVSSTHFDRERLQIPKLNRLMHQLQRWESETDPDHQAALEHYRSLMAGRDGGTAAVDLMTSAGREAAKDALVELHPLANAIVRNRKSELNLGGERTATVVQVSLSQQELDIYDEVSEYLRSVYSTAMGTKNTAVGFLMVIYHKMLTSSSHALRVSFRRRIVRLRHVLRAAKESKRVAKASVLDWDDPEEQSEALAAVEGQGTSFEIAALELEIHQLERMADELDDVRDTKAKELVRLLMDALKGGNDKAVVFTQFIETQLFLAETLKYNGLDVAVFNGRMSAEEKETAIRHFREKSHVLVSTEAGGEGRNLQFANIIVNYDLPWNPMKVEQRIGRLDRIGQTKPVEIFNLVCKGTIEERILEVLRDRIRLFEESIGALDPILGGIEKDIERMAFAGSQSSVDAQFRQFGRDLERRVQEARLLEQTMADFVLDRASFRLDEANRLLGKESFAQPAHLRAVIERGLEHLGGTVTDHAEGGSVINLSPRLASRIGVRETTWRGVFSPEEAVRMDDLDFFACGHSLVDRLLTAMAELPDGKVGCRHSSSVGPGTWVEVIYRLSAELVVEKSRLVRHLVNEDGVIRSQELRELPLEDKPSQANRAAWVADGVARSDRLFQREFRDFRLEHGDRFEDDREQKLLRLKRVFESQRQRLTSEIESAEEWLAERSLEIAVSARDQKILPARRGRLEKQRARLADLEQEYSADREALLKQELAVHGEVIGASIVLGG